MKLNNCKVVINRSKGYYHELIVIKDAEVEDIGNFFRIFTNNGIAIRVPKNDKKLKITRDGKKIF